MENFWMYQVEKLEEEEAKRKEQTESREEDEVLMNIWSLWSPSKFGDVKSLITKTLFLTISCSFFQHWDCVQ